MSRLQHSHAGFLRALQIGSAALAVLTEGRLDRPFYSGVVRRVLSQYPHLGYTICSAKEIGAAAGGKTILLGYYDYLRRRARLISDLGGKRTLVIFCLDKDLDDITRRKRRSPNVIYTEYFDVESYLFLFGDLAAATSAAAEIEEEAIQIALAPIANWLTRSAMRWIDWVTVCVFEITHGCTVCGNYRRCPPPINSATGAVDQARLAQLLARLEAHSNMSRPVFLDRWAKTQRRVARFFRMGQKDKVFKGKWYSWLMAQQVRDALPGRDIDFNAIEGRLPGNLVQSLDFAGAWANGLAERFTTQIEAHLVPH